MMKICRISFNIFLLAALFLAVDCQSASQKEAKSKADSPKKAAKGKVASTLRLHYVINPDGTARCMPITVYRFSPMQFYIDRSPFLHERYLKKATLVTNLGAYEICIEFDPTGLKLWDTVSTSQKGKHIAIYSDFGESRWLAAPLVTQRYTNGIFNFTPDASREESERIVKGLNDIAAKNQPKK